MLLSTEVGLEQRYAGGDGASAQLRLMRMGELYVASWSSMAACRQLVQTPRFGSFSSASLLAFLS